MSWPGTQLLDADDFMQQFVTGQQSMDALLLNQLQCADIALLNKADLVGTLSLNRPSKLLN